MDENGKIVIFGKQEEKTQAANDKKLDPVVSTPGTIKKKSKGQKLKDEFVVEDAKKVRSYLWSSVIMPSIKDTIWNLITKGLKMFLYRSGEGPDYRAGVPAEVPRINYSTYYQRNAMQQYPVARTSYNYGEVIVGNRGEADDVIRNLRALIVQGGVATIGDLYQLCGMPTQFTDFTYGWRDLADARVIGVDNGYLISLPRPFPI